MCFSAASSATSTYYFSSSNAPPGDQQAIGESRFSIGDVVAIELGSGACIEMFCDFPRKDPD